MLTTNPGLESPLTLPCGAVLKNRLGKSAMSEQLGDREHRAGEGLVRLYRRWAKGGIGLLVTGNVMVDRRALGEPRNVVLESGDGQDRIAAWARAGTADGTHLWMQLNHPGRQVPRTLAAEPVGPSAVRVNLPGFGTPRALTVAEIENLITRFGRSAALAKQAGFTGIQIHGAHGYLVSQFLSPLANVRTDEWGGSISNRMRFLMGAFFAIRAAVGPKFPVSVKLNSADFQRGGFSEGDAAAVVETLDKAGVDLLEISGGTYEQPAMMLGEQRASTQAREAYFLEFAERLRKHAKAPFMVTGGFRTRAGMLAALAGGALDVVGLARPLAVEPELPGGLLAGTIERSAAAPRRLGIAQLEGVTELSWHVLQLHRLAAGKEPKPDLSPARAAAMSLVLQGWGALRRKRA
jgi:2,4-dienoyl-CoA reductase-like NADH-dependent reductase (Old Yellow Enzyme family)